MKPRTITADHSAIEIKVHFQFQKNILYYQLLPSGFLIGDTGTPPSYESQTIIINLQLQKILTIILEFWLSHFYFIIYTSVCFPQLNSFFFFSSMVEWYGKRVQKFWIKWINAQWIMLLTSPVQSKIHRLNLTPKTRYWNASGKIKTLLRKAPALEHILCGYLLQCMDIWKWLKIIQLSIAIFPIYLIIVRNFRMLYASPSYTEK